MGCTVDSATAELWDPEEGIPFSEQGISFLLVCLFVLRQGLAM
jgi:hypothetical protein